ncbi:hypothetical protein L484_008578 [Morus notabilis]|uniref:Transmembrane protein n=1 Tax=Morus notabilis TaxID=981085 RepID=W9R5J3_9ROSA|nr:uncharacterized protein LOC21391939 [Morus notabilis]XP_024017064.1 uncharacterized protein LOC21391939 [Morus notabilis]XP_024017065.1 uncharacterized protein LOC21391939 [Morus notabilis]EXB38550.1 hypothetical protein L484_008578 [Morus notabilis]
MVLDGFPQDPNDREEIKPWTMVVIRDSVPKTEFSVFPPINHENLHLSSRSNHEKEDPFSPPFSLSPSSSLASSSSFSSFSPSDSDLSDPDSPVASESLLKRSGEVGRWWVGIGLEVLRARVLRLVSSFGGNGVVWWKASCFAAGAGIAAAVMLWSFYVRARHRKRVKNLKAVVREKNEKINQLLHQIAQLNEVLIARHRVLASKVPN